MVVFKIFKISKSSKSVKSRQFENLMFGVNTDEA